MFIGLVKWFDPDKGFGVIGNPDEGEIFMHINNFINRPQSIPKGTAIVFKKRFDSKKNKNTAENCRVIGEPEDWKLALSYLGKIDYVKIEVKITGKGKRGNPYHRREIQSFSLMNLAAKQIFKGKSEDEISNLITGYYDNELNMCHFISYCEFVENKVTEKFVSEQATALLNSVFRHFGHHLNEAVLFQVWKNKKFKFISYHSDEYEIPETILKNFGAEINAPELKRIRDFTYGAEFCTEFISSKFSNLNLLNSEKLTTLYSFLEFTSGRERGDLKIELDNIYAQKVITEIITIANNLEIIKNHNDFYKYNSLIKIISNKISDNVETEIKTTLNEIIASRCSEEYKPELWIKGIIDNASFEFILKIFLDGDTPSDKRTIILSKLQLNQQLELLINYSEKTSFEKAFNSLESLVIKENSLGYNFKISEKLFDIEFWKTKKCDELVDLFKKYVNEKSNEEEKYELFFKGLLKDVPLNLTIQNIDKLERDDCAKIFGSLHENRSFIFKILRGKILSRNIDSFEWMYSFAKQYLDSEYFSLFDEECFRSIEPTAYFNLWQKGKAKIFPNDYIAALLNDEYKNYEEIKKWVNGKVLTSEEISNYLLSYLSEQIPVTDRKIFYKQYNCIKYLLQSDELHFVKIKQLKNSFYEIILWVLDKDEVLNFELLKLKFIYFSPEEQVKIVCKLFSLKAIGKFDLTTEKLGELTRFDLDLYGINLEFNPTIPIDISTDVVVKVLASFQQNKRFLLESELLSVILNDLKLDKTRRFKLSNYFENCLGRQTAKFDWSVSGKIRKVSFGNNQFYFAIYISPGEAERVNDRRGGREVYQSNPNFEQSKDAVKKLQHVKWNPEEKHWGVPSQYESEVLAFAKENRFFLDFEGSNYLNNGHLAEFHREDIPNGISFCEGRLANRQDETFKKIFWWCAGQPCFEKCEHIHKPEEWTNYTLLDFCEILGFNTDEINRMGDFIPKGIYYQFIALINRFNRLLERLYCKDCNQILYPVDTGHFAAHTVVRFHCVNQSCTNNDEVYLNHCLNGKCNSIIDSRVSKKCCNGLFICENCGSCCSHEMLNRRLENLQKVGGSIHSNLIKCVNEKLGHLERGEYFCYKCKNVMYESSTDVFNCSSCNVIYDTTIYKFKRPHRHLRATNGSDLNNGE